jgi:hypothetical protein
MKMRTPSKKTLIEKLGLTSEKAELIRALIEKRQTPMNPKLFPRTCEWYMHQIVAGVPPWYLKVLEAITETMGFQHTYGISRNLTVIGECVDVKDISKPTIIFDTARNKFVIMSVCEFIKA